MSFFGFHSIIEQWFWARFQSPTEPQRQAWPQIASGRHTLVAAPTGSGKTFAAFLSVVDRLLRAGLQGTLDEGIKVVYVSPLRALSNDMHRNLVVPLQEIMGLVESAGLDLGPDGQVPELRVGLRTGDTTASQRAALVRRPPHILVTTPESLYLMLTAQKSREKLQSVETVIVDEIHALVRDKRGSHLALSLERLEALVSEPPQRIGLSATQRPIQRMAEFLLGKRRTPDRDGSCAIIDVGHARELDLAIEVPPSELGAVCMHEQWAEVNARIVELINTHRSTLIFVNTRRLAERLTHQLAEILGEDVVDTHHGSLAAETRQNTERRLKDGELKAVVATASLELGLDVGYIDLVIQIGTPRSIATLLQRVGRSGHSLGLVPKGRLFALTRDELMECMALLRAVRGGRLDSIDIPDAPIDVLAQQIVAEVSAQEWSTDELFELCRCAYPYRGLTRDQFDDTIHFLSEGITHTSGRSRVYLHHDHVGRQLRARKGARIAATCNAGAIPEVGSYRVVVEPEHTVVGTLDEDFATETLAGTIFLLGNNSWRIQYVRGGDVTVTDAHGAPPTIPFWRGEAPGRTSELSEEVSGLRAELEERLNQDPNLETALTTVRDWLVCETGCSEFAAAQMVHYASAQVAAIGLVPTQKRIVFERFFDESGGMQMVIHAPFGSRINKAWGLAMRKRFCRSFDFELQATADDDGFILSLGPQHSFPLESMFSMLNAANIRSLLEQAILAVPMFQIRWRWNVTRALLVLRRQNGTKVPPAFQRFRADDLLTAVFPKLTGCQENVVGDIELPDQPLVQQTMQDCLHEALDLKGLLKVVQGIETGEFELVARDTREPSPFCHELLNANPYAFLDGGEIQERRTRAVAVPRSLDSVRDLGRLDAAAIECVRQEAEPIVRTADELHDVLLSRIVLPNTETGSWGEWYAELAATGRAATLTVAGHGSAWIAAERVHIVQMLFANSVIDPPLTVPNTALSDVTTTEARVALVRGLMEVCGPVRSDAVATRTFINSSQTGAALEALEGEGIVLRGHFTPAEQDSDGSADPATLEWCHRRLLARIHRLTIKGLRRQIEPVGVDVFIRFLTGHHGLHAAEQRGGTNGVFEAVSMLQGIDIPAICWERDLLPSRILDYRPELLDELCLSGEISWGRLFPAKREPNRRQARPATGITRVAPVSLFLRSDFDWLTSGMQTDQVTPTAAAEMPARKKLSGLAEQVFELLDRRGAMFNSDLLSATRMLPSQLDNVLGELVTLGLVASDGFSGLRKLINVHGSSNRSRRTGSRGRRRRPGAATGLGRWSLWQQQMKQSAIDGDSERDNDRDRGGGGQHELDAAEQWAWQLLRRWGVVFRDLLARENGAPRWFQLLRIYRRLEARGEIRGGRFIAGVAGEQFALGETIRKLRRIRDDETKDDLVVVVAADPLNLIGILTNDARVPSTAANRVAYLNGQPLAALVGRQVQYFSKVPRNLEQLLVDRLQGRPSERSIHVPLQPPTDQESNAANEDDAKPQEQNEPTTDRRLRYPNQIPRPMIS